MRNFNQKSNLLIADWTFLSGLKTPRYAWGSEKLLAILKDPPLVK